MKCSLMNCILASMVFLSLTGCGEDSNPTAPLSTGLDKAWLLGNWIEVKFEYNYMDGTELEKGIEYYNEATTKSYTRFTQNNAYWYYIDGSDVQVDTMSYSAEAKLFSDEDYDFKIERKGDTLIIKDIFTDGGVNGYEYDYYIKFNGALPF